MKDFSVILCFYLKNNKIKGQIGWLFFYNLVNKKDYTNTNIDA